jgi:Alpha/beta hydrolase family
LPGAENKRGYGFHPILVWLDNTNEALAGVLRPGNAGANTAADHIEALDAALAQIPDTHRHRVPILVRADGAGGTKDFANHVRGFARARHHRGVDGSHITAGQWVGRLRTRHGHGDASDEADARNPLRSLSSDPAYLRSVLQTIPGPIVLVGHSYGGAVISNAAVGVPNVKALSTSPGSRPTKARTWQGWSRRTRAPTSPRTRSSSAHTRCQTAPAVSIFTSRRRRSVMRLPATCPSAQLG